MADFTISSTVKTLNPNDCATFFEMAVFPENGIPVTQTRKGRSKIEGTWRPEREAQTAQERGGKSDMSERMNE